MREFTVTTWGLAAVAFGHWVGGLDWIAAVFFFFPAFGLVSGVINNEGDRIVKNVIVMLALPVLPAVTPQLTAKICAMMSASNGTVNPSVRVLVTLLLMAAFLCGFSCIAEIPSRIIGKWSMPERIHGTVSKALVFVANFLALLVFVQGLRFLNQNLVRIPSSVLLLLVLAGVGLFVLSLWRLVSRPIALPLSASNESSGKPTVRLAERPTVTFADVAGMSDVKEQIRLRLVEPVRHAARARQYGLKVGGGMLLYGPPGTGKTLLARAVAGELGLPFYVITPADVFGKYVGESERNIRRIFGEIRKNKLSVVFIDELETLFPNRSSDVHESTRKVISVLLQELDGIEQGKNPMLLLGATNVPWLVDESFMRPGRFDVKTFVGLPDAEARRGMLIKAFARGTIPHEPGLTAYMANATPHYSGADLNGIMNRLRQLAYDRHMAMYTRDLADEVIALSSPTANGETLDKIRDWEAENLPENSSNSGSAGIRLAVMPNVTLDDVAGMEHVKEQIRLRLVEPVQHRTVADLYGLKVGGGVLLYGPPGTGKTFLARAVAGELRLPFYCITAADIFGRFVGESERNVKRLFREIRKNDLSVVFIDEMESIFPKRTGVVDESTRKVISVLLQELDGLDREKNPILLIGATNVPWLVDEAFLRPGRFDVKIFVDLPDADARRQMFIAALYACKIPHEEGLTAFLANRTEGYTGADINGLVDRMKQIAYVRRLDNFDHFLAEEVISLIPPTDSREIREKIQMWKEKGRI